MSKENFKEVLGLSIYNGFRKGRWYQWGWDSGKIADLKTKYIDNNRVKLLEIFGKNNGIQKIIELKDTPSRQDFDDIFLPKGIYKAYIREVYKGIKWDDTCLGEIVFHSASAKDTIEKDDYLTWLIHKVRK